MSSSKINEAVKEAVIAEVKKLTGYNRKPSGPWVFRKEGIKVKIQGRTLCIYTRDTSITINLERTDSSDLIWQKAAEMLEICKEVQKTEDTYPETIFPDKSVGYYFNQLKEPLRTKALSQAKNLSEPAEGLAWALNTYQILPWDSTVEGSSFWSNVHDYFNSGKTYEDSEGSKLAAQCAPDNYVFPYKKETPEYIPPSPPVNPIEVALAEIDKLKGRLDELESTMEGVKEVFDNAEETPEFVDRLKNYASNPATFNTFWKKKFGAKEETTSDYAPTREQCEALWLLVKDGDKSFPNALPFKFFPHRFQPNVLHVEVPDNFEFTISPNKFYPFVNSKGERPTFDQCRQAIAGTLASTLETLFNDGVK